MAGREYFLDEYLGMAATNLDDHGQPLFALNAKRRLCRAVNEMLGICKGLLADGTLVDAEITFLKEWFQANQEVVANFPAREIYDRIQRIYEDGSVSEEERDDLKQLLVSATGLSVKPTTLATPAGSTALRARANPSTTMPFDDPEPEIEFVERSFSFTGKFVSGTRSWCAEQIVARGGRFDARPNSTTNVLVIGALGSRDWAHTSFGRKIEAALKFKPPLKIVSEQHWAKHLR